MSRADEFRLMKARGEKIVVLTAYDAPTARTEIEAGVDIVMVGDSVGTNVLGYASEREVTLADMAHHIAAVRRGAAG
ncbi:MAG TPA: 3-methyl-2-oxobutanoate hydroxymethyltransferase, partial [Methylosinus sp.]